MVGSGRRLQQNWGDETIRNKRILDVGRETEGCTSNLCKLPKKTKERMSKLCQVHSKETTENTAGE